MSTWPEKEWRSVIIQNNLKCAIHFKHIMTVSSQRLHILKLLKRQGLSLEMLHSVFYAIIVSKLVYGTLLGTAF